MILKATGADPLFIAAAIYAACTQSPWWLAAVPLVIASWFLNPRWDSTNGFRFLHDQIDNDK